MAPMRLTSSTPLRLPLAALLAVAAAVPALRSIDETVEPPNRFKLVVDGREVEVSEGAPFSIQLGDKSYEAVLNPEPTRTLSATGISFGYPRGMSFEYEADEGSRIWTLDGNSVVVMLFKFDEKVGQKDFVGGQLAAYEELGDVEQRAVKLALAGADVQGTWIGVQSASFSMAVEIYPLGSPNGSERWLVLQDSRAEVSEPTEEFESVRALLTATYASGD